MSMLFKHHYALHWLRYMCVGMIVTFDGVPRPFLDGSCGCGSISTATIGVYPRDHPGHLSPLLQMMDLSIMGGCWRIASQ